MPLPLRDFVQQVLLENDRASKVFVAIHKAWASAVLQYPQRARWLRKSTFRGIVWEEAIKELHTLALEDPGVKLVPHRDTISFILEDAVLFRFKHADLSLATSNYPTPEARAFDEHDIDLYGFSGLQRVELCYVLNEFETAIVWVGVSARANGEWLWKIELGTTGVVNQVTEPELFEESLDPQRLASLKQSKPDSEAKEQKKRDG
ncbi:hypothetical protein C0075_20570 [Rhizobium sp. KAs_5_22]|uniref:hypothetical protein n=1 Tax=Ciceribacter selenitireducens TaxID=448181 RepID=UPI00048B25DE|nr:hypothetical protein [Ciceribacter selenitireducens]PPJ47907.1 hypothetical protein C0075_20570 [Rhizobium sp. KAs_5_22]